MKYAVVDLGTNSARLMLARVGNGEIVSDMKTLRMIRIGEGMVKEKRVCEAAMKRTRDALYEFLEISRGYGAKDFLCFATSAVREAVNREDFLKYIKVESGVDIEVISGDEEAMLGFAGSVEGEGGMFDIGGGSTEVMLGSLGNVKFKRSFPIGTVKFQQLFPEADEAQPEAMRKAHELASQTFFGLPSNGGVIFTGIGGSATALAAIDLGLKEYSAQRVQGHIITLDRAEKLCLMLESKTKQQRKAITGLEEKRADVIVFGAIIMYEFMKAAGTEKITVSDRDNQEGYLAVKLGLIRIPS